MPDLKLGRVPGPPAQSGRKLQDTSCTDDNTRRNGEIVVQAIMTRASCQLLHWRIYQSAAAVVDLGMPPQSGPQEIYMMTLLII